MKTKLAHYILLLHYLLLSSCSEENQPNNPPPELTLYEAQYITRTSAELSGTISIPSGSLTDICHFRYGTSSSKMEELADCSLESGKVSVILNNLSPGVTYYYCLEAGNRSYLVQSNILNFVTMPNEAPKLEKFVFLGQGPVSITAQCAISDNGGETVTKIGFVYSTEGEEEQEAVAFLSEDDKWRLRISGLKENTNYTIKGFAENKIGRTYSDSYNFQTRQAIIVASAGTLPDIIDEKEKYGYSELNIAGPLNGTDIRFIREMMGRDIYGRSTKGKLSRLDLTDASIIAGGLTYNETRYTEKDVIGYGMFGELELLESLKMPEGTLIVEQDAFRNSVGLTEIVIPEKTHELLPSVGCSKLSRISISSANNAFNCIDGVLYSKSGETLIWLPEGLSGDEILFSPTLKSLGDFALQNCRIRTIVLPNSVTQLGKQVFYNAAIESVVLPDGIRTISYGMFQGCLNLTSVTLGSSCELISDYSFDRCPIKELYVKASLPPVCKSEAFTGATQLFSECTLHVPAKTLDLYKVEHKVWSRFLKISPISF